MPLGLLIAGPFEHTTEKLKQLIEDMRPGKIVTVGDGVSESLTKEGIYPHVLIVDNRIMRKPIAPIKVDTDQTLHLRNPPGKITDEAWHIIREALNQEKKVKIVVEGEEDLLTLVAVACAPENSVVIYGQPHEGIVVVRVTEETKGMVSKLVDEMESEARKVNLGDENSKRGKVEGN